MNGTCPYCHAELPPATATLDAATGPERKARRHDPDASRLAALQNAPRAGSQRDRLLAVFRTHPEGLTSAQAAGLVGIPETAASSRCTELLRGGWLERLPELRRTLNGGSAHIFVATDKALSAPEQAAA